MPHLGDDVVEEVVVFAGVGTLQVLLQFCVGQFVGLFELAVLSGVLLDGVVGEVDEGVAASPEVELGRGGAHVALLVPVGFEGPVDAGHQHVVS